MPVSLKSVFPLVFNRVRFMDQEKREDNFGNLILSVNPIVSTVIVLLFCLQNSIYVDSLWNAISFENELIRIVQPFWKLTFVASFISAFLLWIISTTLFHITALIFSERERNIVLLLKASAVLLTLPLIAEFSINIIFNLQNVRVEDVNQLKQLLTTYPFCCFKYIIWISYTLYLSGIVKLIQPIYKINLKLSLMSVFTPLLSLIIITLIFKNIMI